MTRFERYPGPPSSARGGGERDNLYRVISPWRDALAWVSIAGRLRLVEYLLRDGDGWRSVPLATTFVADDVARPMSSSSAVDESPIWELHHRDPVELVFACTLPGIDATASVTVGRTACEVRLEIRKSETAPLDPTTLVDCIAAEVVRQADRIVVVRFSATSVIP